MQILEKVRETRVAVDDEEFKPGIFCFAAPVFSHRREALYSIGISGSADMIKPWSREYGTLIREAGREASDLLGYSG
jgi:DNA-binding IclR family transcriptional regulator